MRKLENVNRRLDNILQDGEVRPQVELLKNHSQPATNPVDLARIARFHQTRARLLHLDTLTAHNDFAGVGYFEQIDTTQEGAFSRPARAKNRHNLMVVSSQRDTAQNLERAKPLLDIGYGYRGCWLIGLCIGHNRHSPRIG